MPADIRTENDAYTPISGEVAFNHNPTNAELNSAFSGRVAALQSAIDTIIGNVSFDFSSNVPYGWWALAMTGNGQHILDWLNTSYPTVVSDVNALIALSNGSIIGTLKTPVAPFSGDYNDLTNKPTRSWANPSRSLNTAFQVSSTKDALVSYAVDIACALSLTTGQQGTVYLEYADQSGFTTGVTEVTRFVNGNTGSLTIGLNLTQNATGTLTGMIPAGKYARLRTQNNTGTPTFTFRVAQEVLV